MHRTDPNRRALLALAALALLVPGAAAEAAVPEAVAWLAQFLGREPSDLPASVPMTELHVADGAVVERVRDAPLLEVALLGRAASVDVAPSVPSYAGAGVRSSTTGGIGWSGIASGPVSMACIAPTALAAGPTVPANALNAGGASAVMLEAHLPATGSGSGFAFADVLAAPTPSLDGTVAARGGTAAVNVGSTYATCFINFALRISLGGFRGDGTIHG